MQTTMNHYELAIDLSANGFHGPIRFHASGVGGRKMKYLQHLHLLSQLRTVFILNII